MVMRRSEGFLGRESPRAEMGEGLGSAKARREQRSAGMRLRDGTKIEGTIHIMPYSRPMDLLNTGDNVFIAVTDATLTDPEGVTRELPFVAVSRSDIIFLYEVKSAA